MAKTKTYKAKRTVVIGYPEPDPKREGFNLVRRYKEGDRIENVGKIDNLDGLIAAGYLEEE